MILDIVLGVVILFLIAFHLIYVRETNTRFEKLAKEFVDLAKLAKAKDLTDYNVAKMVEETPKEEVNDDLTPVENMEQDKFEELVDKETQ
jgi:hypothetical protein